MMYATKEQQQRILALLEDIPTEQIERVLESGFLPVVLTANVQKINYNDFLDAIECSAAMTQASWYAKALRKTDTFLQSIDKDLRVEIRASEITSTPGKPYAEYRSSLTLSFTHRTNAQIQWTMEIGENDKYIETELQKVVTCLFKEHRGW